MDDRPVTLAERGARVQACRRPARRWGSCRSSRRREARRNGVIRGDRYALPAGMLNSVRSVTRSMFGPSAWKSRVDQILRSPSELALVRAVALRALEQRHHAVLGHEFHDAFGRHRYPHALQFSARALVAVALLFVLERPSTKGEAAASRSGLLMALSR